MRIEEKIKKYLMDEGFKEEQEAKAEVYRKQIADLRDRKANAKTEEEKERLDKEIWDKRTRLSRIVDRPGTGSWKGEPRQ